MPFISYEDCLVNINDKIVFASTATISAQAQISPSRNLMGELIRYCPEGPVNGKLDLSFFLNKSFSANHQEFDILKIIAQPNHLDGFSNGITGSIAGVEFFDAYLNSLNFSVSPFSPVQIKASFDLYGGFTASSNLYGGHSSLGATERTLHPANGVNSFFTAASSLGIQHPISFNYSASINRMTDYYIGESSPSRVCKGAADIEMRVNSEGFGDALKLQGNEAALTTHLYPLYETDPVGSFYCSGQVTSQNLSASENESLKGSLTIKQSLR